MKMNYLLVKYENLILNPTEEFSKISNFIGKLLKNKFRNEDIDNAIKLSSFDNLKNMENKYGFTESSNNKDGKRNKFFFLGPKNDWRKIVDKNIVSEINDKFEPEMKELGYL